MKMIEKAENKADIERALERLALNVVLNRQLNHQKKDQVYTQPTAVKALAKTMWSAPLEKKFPKKTNKRPLEDKDYVDYIINLLKELPEGERRLVPVIKGLKHFLVDNGYADTTLGQAKKIFEDLDEKYNFSGKLTAYQRKDSKTKEDSESKKDLEVISSESSNVKNGEAWESIEPSEQEEVLYTSIRNAKSKRKMKEEIANLIQLGSDAERVNNLVINALKHGKSIYVRSVGRMLPAQIVSMVETVRRKL